LGGVDVIHFQSLEGLSLKVMELKKEFPETKFILSLHNYQCFCPQVNLWKNNAVSCDDFQQGQTCLSCLGQYPSKESFKKYYLLDFYLRKLGLERYSKPLLGKVKDVYNVLKRKPIEHTIGTLSQQMDGRLFSLFRERNVEYINMYIDTVLCVSKRVKHIAERMGVKPDKAVVSYIGSAFASQQQTKSQYPYHGGILKIAYMGYMRKDKGFYFLLDALKNMPEELALKLSVVLAARFDDPAAVEQVKALKYLNGLQLYNGYTHQQIPQILEGVHLGVVPVLWEDNLPQVAIEFKAMGIPVLASDLGGPSELSDSPAFVFRHGDEKNFYNKLDAFIHKPILMDEYWQKQHLLKTMDQHITELMKYYQQR